MRLRRPASAAARAYAGAKRTPAATPWRETEYAVVDLETTGLDPREDEIISFASIPISGGRVIAGEALTLTIRPARMPSAETIRIHGLRPADLEAAPVLEDVIERILAALTGRVLVAHVAAVERGFLSAAVRPAGVRLASPILDTAVLAAAVFDAGEDVAPPFRRTRSGRAPGLSDTARRLGLPVHRPHHADGDALTTAQVFLALATRLEAVRPQTVRSLALLSKR